MRTILIKFTAAAFLFHLLACKKFIQIDPAQDQVVTEKVYANDETAIAAIRGIYAQMMSATGFASGGGNSVSLMAGRSADEFTNYNVADTYIQFSTNNLVPDNAILRSGLWQEPYKYIYFANSVLENLNRSGQVSAELKRQLQGEAKFIRAFCHFYLHQLFGQVPLILTTDYRINALASANTSEQIYAQLITDLISAKALLSDNYPSAERIRPNKWAATALLARVYLYHKEWKNAELQATEVIEQADTYELLDDLNKVFLKSSKETILQLFLPANFGLNTREAGVFILTTAPGSSTHVVLSPSLLSAFEPGDQRLIKWVGTFSSGTLSWRFPYKYKVRTGATPLNECSTVLRLAEQHLIRAEALTMQNSFIDACKDLNKIRKRALLGDITYNTQAQLLLAIEQERRVELFSEWGHRWLDLKRTARAETVLAPVKGANWQPTDVLYPIPASDLANNQNLIQNKGYQ